MKYIMVTRVYLFTFCVANIENVYCFLVSSPVSAYCAGDKMEKNEMVGECGTYGGRERCAQGFSGET